MIPKQRASELQLIDYIRKRFPRKRGLVKIGIGDDAMVMKNGMVVSTDSFAEGVHFNFKYFKIYDLGYRAMAGSLSDLAAMAAKPVCALISLYLPKKTTQDEIAKLYDGFYAAGRDFRLEISGGDIIESPFWGVTITGHRNNKKSFAPQHGKAGAGAAGHELSGTGRGWTSRVVTALEQKGIPKSSRKTSLSAAEDQRKF